MHFLGVVKEANLIKHYNIKIVKKNKKQEIIQPKHLLLAIKYIHISSI